MQRERLLCDLALNNPGPFVFVSCSLQPRALNMATALAGLTQQSNANVLGVKLMTQLQLVQQQDEGQQATPRTNVLAIRGGVTHVGLDRSVFSSPATASFHQSNSSSHVAPTPVIHTHPSSLPLSFLGHDVAFRPDPDTAESVCGANTALTESVHVFGRTEELSHQQLIQKMEKQPPALFRRVSVEQHTIASDDMVKLASMLNICPLTVVSLPCQFWHVSHEPPSFLPAILL
jgi:hypothetical protein